MKKFIAGLLAGLMVLSLVACGGDNGSDVEMNIAMITDSGDITDQSFNQTTYEAAKAWSDANSDISSFTYYKPTDDNDEARIASVDQAIARGANIILLPGYMFAAAVVEKTKENPDVKFIALDMAESDIAAAGAATEGKDYYADPSAYKAADYYNTDNTYVAIYQEEISGYMAGYAAVKLGYRHMGFLGGMSVPAVIRYGYGFIQGANDAAAELGVSGDVTVEYVYGGSFSGDADITAYMDTWYSTKGVEVVFACGGGIFTSACEAAAKVNGKVIGVDSDQAPVINGGYGAGMTVTSAMKGLAATVNMVLEGIKNGQWSSFTGKIENLGMVSDDPELNYVQLPLESTQWNDGFTKDDYLQLVKNIHAGSVAISSDTENLPSVSIQVNEYGNIK